MGIFLSKEEQEITEPLYSIGLWFTPDDKMHNIITAQYFDDCVEYYLFNKIRVWKKKEH